MAGHIPTALSCDWCTPDRTLLLIEEALGKKPDLDPCSNPHSHVGAKHSFMLQNGRDGLRDDWGTVDGDDIKDIFVNPPYGKGWWKPAPHTDYRCALRSIQTNLGCMCGADGKREYIWPTDRQAFVARVKAGELTKADLAAIFKPYTMVSLNDWIKRAAYNGQFRNVIGLVPSYPDTKAWQKDIFPRARAIFFPKGRMHFRLVYTLSDDSTLEKTGPAPMAVAMPLWTPNQAVVDRFMHTFEPSGKVIIL